jgi:protein-disulfide isomerase
MALASPFRKAAALVGALALLAACGGQSTAAPDGFTPVPVTPVIGDVPIGAADAPVTILEYASYTCSHCRDFWKQDFPRLKTNYIDTGKVKFIYRDYPLDDSLALTLAALGRCKGKDAYFAVVDDIFSNQYEILVAAQNGQAGPVLLGIAERHGMSPAEVRTCMDHQPELRASILASREEGTSRGVNSTPAVFINDERVENHTYDNLVKLIEAELNPGAAPATTPADDAAPATPPAPTEGAPASAPAQ